VKSGGHAGVVHALQEGGECRGFTNGGAPAKALTVQAGPRGQAGVCQNTQGGAARPQGRQTRDVCGKQRARLRHWAVEMLVRGKTRTMLKAAGRTYTEATATATAPACAAEPRLRGGRAGGRALAGARPMGGAGAAE
jgi:hypothetical protein